MIMKKTIIRFFAISAMISLVAVACSKAETDVPADNKDNTENPADVENPENQPSEGFTLTASLEEAIVTRTSLGDADGAGNRAVTWSGGDAIKVIYNGGDKVVGASNIDGADAQFVIGDVAGFAGDAIYMHYPSDASASQSEGVLSITIPSEQDGNFANHSYLVAKASTSENYAKFFNACAMFRIDVADADIKKAEITGNDGEALAGTVGYRWDGANNEEPTVTGASSTSTSITVTFNGAGTYYVAALPGLNLTTGVTVKFYKEGATPGTYDVPAGGNATSSALAVARAQIASFGSTASICHRYVSTTADGSRNGRSADAAWNVDQLVGFLSGKWNGADVDAAKLAAMNGLTIDIAAGEYTMPNADINLGSTFTQLNIVGESGATFAGNGSVPILHQNRTTRAGTTVSFDNITFTGGRRSGDHGGAFYFSYGTVKFKDCSFTNNQTLSNDRYGGVLHFYNTADGVFEDCSFTGNSAAGTSSNGGVLNVQNTHHLTFIRCSFYNNTTTQYGGVANVSGSGSVIRFEDCDFGDGTDGNRNSANSYGGVFHIEKVNSLDIVNCRFNNNTASSGGAIFTPSTSTFEADAVHIKGCRFIGHSTSSHGGVARIEGGTLNFEKNEDTPCTFTGNSASNGGVFYMLDGGINDNGSVYKQNHGTWGGAITAGGGTAEFTSCVFGTDGTPADKNYAAYGSGDKENGYDAGGGGVFNQNGGNATFIKCAFYGNEAQGRQGGAIRRATEGDSSNTLTIKGCTFKGNMCSNNSTKGGSYWAGGGAIFFQKGTLNIQESDDHVPTTFESNYSCYRGGAVCVDGDATATISQSDFNGNYTTGENKMQLAGGAIHVTGTADANLTDCIFNGNYSSSTGYGGGAVAMGNAAAAGSIIKMNKCLFKDNYGNCGGALINYGKNTKIYLNSCAFTGNHISGTYGVVIQLYNDKSEVLNYPCTLCMNNCSFADNQYTASGNGQQSSWINMKGLSKVVMSNCSLIGRTRNSSGTADSYNPNLLRFDGALSSGNYLINNIIAMTPTSGTFYSSDMQSSPVTGYFNKMSTVLNGSNYTPGTGSASDFRGTNTYFGDLGSDMTEGAAAKDCYWSWNGTLATGSNLDKAALADVNSTINTADSGFYNWLDSIGALTTDCRGKDRGDTTWPGAYDGTNN